METSVLTPPRVAAYSVPFSFERDRAPEYRLRNVSSEAVYWVRIKVSGPAVADAMAPFRLEPGESARVLVKGLDLERGTSLQVSWLRLDGAEYLWRVTF